MKGPPTYYRFQFYVGLAAGIAIILDQFCNTLLRMTVAGKSIPIASILLAILACAIAGHAWYKINKPRRRKSLPRHKAITLR